MQVNKTLLTIIVVSYDGAEELWEGLNESYKVFWNNCPYKKILLTQKKIRTLSEFDILRVESGGEEATYRIFCALKECCSDYVLLICDDYFLSDKVDLKRLIQICKLMERDNVNVIHLKQGNKYKVKKYNGRFPVSGGVPSIYRRNFLLSIISEFNHLSMRKMESNSFDYLKDKKIIVLDVYSKAFVCEHCVLEGYWRLVPFLKVKHKGWISEFRTYKRPNIIHSIYATLKAFAFNVILNIFPNIYNIYSKNKYGVRN